MTIPSPPPASAAAARAAIRAGEWRGHTSGLLPRQVQGNVVILPRTWAEDFQHYCQRNAQACPLLAVGATGDPHLPMLGSDIDLRSDLPAYRVWRDGVLHETCHDIHPLWRDDLVSFVLGCSFSFDAVLEDAGIALRHRKQGLNVSMYRTTRPTRAAGPFQGPLVVSMRPLSPADAERAAAITRSWPQLHGGPVHQGDPAALGIADLSRPDYGDAVAMAPDELPVFWACGVTPQAALEAARLPFCITHAPGHMLITDLTLDDLCA